jgi:hypothetical protein
MAMKRLLLASAALIALMACAQGLRAQSDYLGSVGLRLGPGFGITGKYFLNPSWAVEGHFTSRRRGYQLTALAQRHHDLGLWRNLNGYYGGGAHLGFSEYQDTEAGHQRTQATVGFDGVVGLEYTFRALPLNLALDWKPEFNLSGATGFCAWCGGVSVRYALQGHRYRVW